MPTARLTKATLLAAVLSLSIVSGAAAIGDETDPEVAYCSSLMELAASVQSLGAISPSSTVDQFDGAVDRIQEAATGVEESLRGLVDAQVAALETAVGDLQGYRDALTGDETLEEAVQGAGEAIEAVGSARDAIGTLPNCAVVAGQQAAQEEMEE